MYVHSLTIPSITWTSAQNNPFETAKAVIVARMISGRYRCEAISAYWSSSNGNCQAPSCINVRGDIEHLLLKCQALAGVREKMLNIWRSKTEHQYPELFSIMSQIMASSSPYRAIFSLIRAHFPALSPLVKNMERRSLIISII